MKILLTFKIFFNFIQKFKKVKKLIIDGTPFKKKPFFDN